MNNRTTYSYFKIITILLVAVLISPSIVKFNHVFENHKHEVCVNNSFDHFHELEIDCEFYKFNTTNHFLFENFVESTINISIKSVLNYSYYEFLNNHKKLQISLRGPPHHLV